jgi:DNA-binding CsgD family transcriptional regulator
MADEVDNPGVLPEAAEAARAAPAGPEPPRVVDVVLDALSLRFADGYAAAAPVLVRALELLLAPGAGTDEVGRWFWLTGGRAGNLVAVELWDAESWHTLAARQVRFARDTGALVHLQYALNLLAITHLLAGELSTAALMTEEDRLIAEAVGNPSVGYAETLLAAWRGRETQAATNSDLGTYASSVLYNGIGRHDAARDAAWQVFERDQVGYGPLVAPELAEAASRTGDMALVREALRWLSERTRVIRSEWALGIEARVRALLSEGDLADGLYRESIDHLGRTRLRVELARGHLLYGEWLRRERRRVDARVQLHSAHDMLATMGVEAFAARAERELLATGEAARKRTVETNVELTAQEAQIARLARDGLSNPEIGTRLFISPRTVKYHLRKVFTKLGISSRTELDRALPGGRSTVPPL